MLRVIFDTNIYGKLLIEPDGSQIEESIIKDKEFVVYGYKPIRDEIRRIPKTTKINKKNRVLLLKSYDNLTGKHLLRHSAKITWVAKKYYDIYRANGGIYKWDTSLRYDFMIVACASMGGLDVVYSADAKTLLAKPALRAYRHINLKENMRSPQFLKYEDLLKKFRNLL